MSQRPHGPSPRGVRPDPHPEPADAATRQLAASNEAPELTDPRRFQLERIAREVMAAKQYHAPATFALDFIDALLAEAVPGRYYVGCIKPGEDDHETLDAALAELASLREECPDEEWRLFAIADITERTGE